jgi:two-component system sensor histidine kinase RegB
MSHPAVLSELSLSNSREPSVAPIGWRTVTLGRTLMCLLLGAALLVAVERDVLTLPSWWQLTAVAAAAFGFARAWRSVVSRARDTGAERVAALLFDVVVLGLVLLASGPDGRPLSALLLLPVAVAALALPLRRAMLIHAGAIAAFTAIQLSALHGAYAEVATPLSPWILWSTVAAMVALFAFRLADLQRLQRHRVALLDDRRQQHVALQDFATLAAGTAHEMGTPLSTLAMLLGDLRRETAPPSDWKQAIDVLWQATQACRRSLHDMAAEVERGHAPVTAIAAAAFCDRALARFAQQHPGVRAQRGDCAASDPDGSGVALIAAGHPIQQALLNLLDNAARVSPGHVTLALAWDDRQVRIDVCDRGPGIAPAMLAQLGRGPLRRRAPLAAGTDTAEGGHGIGVFLASTAIARAGGQLAYLPRPGGGTVARLTLPRVLAPAAGSSGERARPAARDLPALPAARERFSIATSTIVSAMRMTGIAAGLGSSRTRTRRREGNVPTARTTMMNEEVHVPGQR